MKNIFYILFAFSLITFYACDEIPPDVSNMTGMQGGGNTGVNVDDQVRHALIEEFTGVRCINCPAGSAAIENLLDSYGGELVAISIHSGFFSPPYSQSLYDLQTPDGDNLLNYLGQPIGFPTAVVNRKSFSSGSDELQINQSDWAGAIATELQEAPKVKIGVEHTYDAASGAIDLTATLFVQETVTDPDTRITVMITESGIIDHQLTPQSSPDTDPDYVHKHVLRDIITNFDGNPISTPLTAGAEISEPFSFTIPSEWDADKCEIIVLVHQNGVNKEVLQVVQVHLVE